MPKLVIHSKPGIGDVNIRMKDGKEMNENIIPMVAVPFSPKSYELACKRSEYTQVKLLRINFMLVHEDGDITMVNFKSNEL